MRDIRVMIWGFGAMGSGIARMLLKKTGVEIVGVVVGRKPPHGTDVYQYLGEERGAGGSFCSEARSSSETARATWCCWGRTPSPGARSRRSSSAWSTA